MDCGSHAFALHNIITLSTPFMKDPKVYFQKKKRKEKKRYVKEKEIEKQKKKGKIFYTKKGSFNSKKKKMKDCEKTLGSLINESLHSYYHASHSSIRSLLGSFS